MAFARQFFKGVLKKDKVYPWTLAKLVKVLGGGTVQDYLDGTKTVRLASMIDSKDEDGGSHGVTPYWSTSSRVKFRVDDVDNMPVAHAVNAVYADSQRTFDKNNVWHDDRLFYVHEIANGIYQPYVQEPDRVCEIMSKYADVSNDTLKLGGYRVLDQVVVVNPAGNAHAYVHCGGKAVYYAHVINGNWNACKVHIKDIAYDGNLIIFFDTAFSGLIQLNIQMFYKE